MTAEAARARSPVAALLLTTTGGLLLGGFILAAVAAPAIAPDSPDRQVAAPFSEPSADHLLGTDDLGQDLLSQLIYGARVSLAVGIGAAVIATLVAMTVGGVAGLFRGWVDAGLMRTVDIMLAMPLLPLLLLLSTFIDPGRASQMAVIGLLLWPRAAREIRSRVLSISRLGPVDAARSMGAGHTHLLVRHLLPQTLPLVVTQFVRAVAIAIAFESSLSFLGLGSPTSQSWGTILYFANARGAFLTGAWLWWVVPPGLCIGLTVVAFAFIGFGLEERNDPRLGAAAWRPGSRAKRHTAINSTSAERGAPLLVVDGLTVDYGGTGVVRALDQVSLSLERGGLMAVVGPSGSGKSTLAAAILGATRSPGRIVAGRVLFEGVDIAGLSNGERARLRGSVVALVPQAAMNALNPVLSVGNQVAEAVRVHQPIGRVKARERARELLVATGFPAERAKAFAHQLSGGMRQRVAIAMAIANEPRLIIADEPATGLDVVAQAEVLQLLEDLRERTGMAMIVITHDPAPVLLRAATVVALRGGRVAGPEQTPAAVAITRARARATPVADRQLPLLEVTGVRKSFRAAGSGPIRVLSGIDLRVGTGEIVGLLGVSGSGKTTLARIISGLTAPDAGQVVFSGVDLSGLRGASRRNVRRELQMVAQDPYGWLSPHMRVRELVAEPLAIHRLGPRETRAERVRVALSEAGLEPVSRYLGRYPHELSGGERQRVALARALVLNPALIVADEPTSMLDAALRQELVTLFDALRQRRGTAFLYITHDITLARAICDRICVIDEGRIVEDFDVEAIDQRTHHRATKRLLDAANLLAGT